MKIYNYDQNGVFISESIADESPLEPGVFLIPAYATEIMPPEIEEGMQAVFNNGEWIIESKPIPFEETEEYAAMIAENAEKEAKRAVVLEALANAAGLNVEEVKQALGGV